MNTEITKGQKSAIPSLISPPQTGVIIPERPGQNLGLEFFSFEMRKLHRQRSLRRAENPSDIP